VFVLLANRSMAGMHPARTEFFISVHTLLGARTS